MSDHSNRPLKRKRAPFSIPKSVLSEAGTRPTFSLKKRKHSDTESEQVEQGKPTKLNKKRKKKRKTKKSKKVAVKTKEMNQLLDYLHTWKHDRDSWKFNKTIQKLLIKLIYDKEQLPEDKFNVLLEYLENLQGQIRRRVFEEAKFKCEIKEKEEEKPDLWAIERAKKVMKVTEEI